MQGDTRGLVAFVMEEELLLLTPHVRMTVVKDSREEWGWDSRRSGHGRREEERV